MNLVQKVHATSNVGAAYFLYDIWVLANPASGSNNVVVTYSANVDPDAIAAISHTGVDQSTPVGATQSATGNSNNPSLSITTAQADSLIVGGCAVQGGDSDPFTPGADTTERWDSATGTSTSTDIGYAGGEESAATAQAYTFDFTASVLDYWLIGAIELRGVAAGGNAMPMAMDYYRCRRI